MGLQRNSKATSIKRTNHNTGYNSFTCYLVHRSISWLTPRRSLTGEPREPITPQQQYFMKTDLQSANFLDHIKYSDNCQVIVNLTFLYNPGSPYGPGTHLNLSLLALVNHWLREVVCQEERLYFLRGGEVKCNSKSVEVFLFLVLFYTQKLPSRVSKIGGGGYANFGKCQKESCFSSWSLPYVPMSHF